MASNNPPRVRWFAVPLACGTVRHRLYVNDKETPYFVDNAKGAGRGHWTMGDPVGLHGSGMGNEIERRDGSTYRIAATLGAFRSVTRAKATAERMALEIN